MDEQLNIYPLLKWCLSFIDAMVERGALKGSEIVDVATARQQLMLVTEVIEKQNTPLTISDDKQKDDDKQ